MKQVSIYSDNIEPEALNQFYDAMKQVFVVQGALMPDAHMGYTLPIGGVVACKDVIVPAYIGFDIGCGVCAFKTDFSKKEIDENKEKIFYQIYRDLPVGTNKHKKAQKIDEELLSEVKRVCNTVGESIDDAVRKCGTLGGGKVNASSPRV